MRRARIACGVLGLVVGGLLLSACSGGAGQLSPSAANPSPAAPATRPARTVQVAPSGWDVIGGTAHRVVLASPVAHEVALYDDEREALGVLSRYLNSAFGASDSTPGKESSVAWLSGGLADNKSPVYPALEAGPSQIAWTNGVPNATDGASAAFDLRVVAWHGGSTLLAQWAPVTLSGPWVASLPSPARPAYLDLSSRGALLAAFLPFAVEYGAAITEANRVVDEHWDVYSYAELRPGRGGALSIYSPLVHALVWSKIVPILPSAPSYVHSVLAASPPPAGAVPVTLG